MLVKITGRHMGVSEKLKTYCTEKAERLTRLYDRIQSVDVVFDTKDGSHAAEIIVHIDSAPPIVGHERTDDAFAAFDLTLDKVEEQLRRHKERVRNRKHSAAEGA